MVIVQFHGRLVRQYRACVVDSLGLGITCVLYYVYSFAIPIFHIEFLHLLVSSQF